jgi:molybdate transport system ATP-binding protein
MPSARRGIGYVFQESALFPHLSVAGNIAFGLQGWPRAERRARVAELVQLMGLEEIAERRALEVSGGQKQRVALARALAPRPRLVLLDEPFASLDRAAADLLRHNLRQILQTLGVPAILVTHDPQEALALGDRMLLMAEGRIIRDGAPAVERKEGMLVLEVGSVLLFAPDPGGAFREAYACIRGEGVSLEQGPHGHMSQRNRLAATILQIEPLGALRRVRLDAGMPLEAVITTWACEDLELAPGQQVHVLIKASAIQVIPIEA